GFWACSDPTDPNFVYAESQGGHIIRVNRHTLEQRDIMPSPQFKEKLRFNWNTPIALSPNEKGALYIGSQFLFRSRDHGRTWDRISPDLTSNDPVRQRQEQSGGITVDNSSAEMNTTIYSISESPRAAGEIWVGTDDGNVQLTRDTGHSWSNLTANLGMPQGNWISWVEASRFNPAVAYVTDDRHQYGDMQPYLYRTNDFGRSWQRLVGPGTPDVRGYAHVIKEDRLNPNILYLGTEFGLYVSLNGGQSWAQFKPSNFPDGIAVRDIALQDREDDMLLATHGRGIWVIDDISPLRSLSGTTLASTVALIPTRPVEQRIEGQGGWTEGNATFSGDNPPDGAVITYYQRARHVIGRMKLEILDANGTVVDEIPASKRRGLNRVLWSMRSKPPQVPPAASLAGNSTAGERFLPGTYTVRLTKGAEVVSEPLTVTLDRRASFTPADRQSQYDAVERLKALFARMTTVVGQINAVRTQATTVATNPSAPANLKSHAVQLSEKADAIRKEIVATKEGGAITGEERLREHVDSLYGAVNSVEDRPTPYQMQRLDALDRELREVEAQWSALRTGDVAALNEMLRTANLPPLTIAAAGPLIDRDARGGRAALIARGLIGTRFYGPTRDLEEAHEKDR
ncbi:MAG TPA: sialidase, partial [Sphingomicrobium sp.]|nr:sialidase [Sphingomicrobium sp.]